MQSQLDPYLTFSNNAREAMTFYRGVFGGELHITTFDQFGETPPFATPDGVMHAALVVGGQTLLMGSDGGGDGSCDGISLCLSGWDEAELRGYWEHLSAGGEITMPLERQVWGDQYGICKDRFRVSWMVSISAPQA